MLGTTRCWLIAILRCVAFTRCDPPIMDARRSPFIRSEEGRVTRVTRLRAKGASHLPCNDKKPHLVTEQKGRPLPAKQTRRQQ